MQAGVAAVHILRTKIVWDRKENGTKCKLVLGENCHSPSQFPTTPFDNDANDVPGTSYVS